MSTGPDSSTAKWLTPTQSILAGKSSTYNKRESSGVGIFCAEASFRTEMLLLFVLKSEIVAIFEITMIKACVAFLCLYLCVTGFLSLYF